MNSEVLMAAYGASPSVQEGFSEVKRFIQSCEKRFLNASQESELEKLNRSSGAWFHASDDLFSLLLEVSFFYDQTKGQFDPLIIETISIGDAGDAIRAIKEGVTEHSTGYHPSLSPSFRDIKFDRNTHSLRLPPGVGLDLTDIVSGWTVEKATTCLAQYSNACAISIGGVLCTLGLPENNKGWQIGLENPKDHNQTVTTIHIASRYSVATYSEGLSHRKQKGWQNSLLGEDAALKPVDWLSMTVIAHSGTTAEIYAKILWQSSFRDARVIAAQNNQIAAVGIDQNGRLWQSQNSKEFIEDL